MAAVVAMQCSSPVSMLIGSWEVRKDFRVTIGDLQGVISTTKHKIFGKMTPSYILQDFQYLLESKEIFQKFHS